MNSIHIQGVSGLASRLRAVLGGIAYAESLGIPCVVDWPSREPTESLGMFPCKFSELWDSPYQETDVGERFPKWPGIDGRIRADKPDWFAEHITRPIGSYLDKLQPTAELQAIIDSVAIPQPCVGVQIRHSLAQPGTASVDWFVERMWAMPGHCHFFLSCDSLDVRNRIHGEFGGTVQSLPKDFRYDRMGIMRAAADLYLLAKCDWLILSNGSSFGQMVTWMKGNASLDMRKHDPGPWEDLWHPADETWLNGELGVKCD